MRNQNSDNRNSGNWNSGNRNSDNRNSGNWNSGDWNSGDWNSGNRNSGNWNSGNRNSGNRNSGNRNSGYRNSGYWNSGNQNSGNQNSGNWNSGNWNSGYWNSGAFNTDTPTVRMFNKDTGLRWEDISFPDFLRFDLNTWIPEYEMTDKEKIDYPDFYVVRGYLKSVDYKTAFRNAWDNAGTEARQQVFNLPNFDADIFYEISGIDVRSGMKETVTITVENNKSFEISRESAKALGLI